MLPKGKRESLANAKVSARQHCIAFAYLKRHNTLLQTDRVLSCRVHGVLNERMKVYFRPRSSIDKKRKTTKLRQKIETGLESIEALMVFDFDSKTQWSRRFHICQ